MANKNTAILVCIALVSTAGVAIVELGPRRQQQAIEQAGKQLFSLNPDDIETLTSTSRDYTFQLEREGDIWQLLEPVRTQAETAAVSTLLATLTTLEIQSSIEEGAASLSDYGLEPPQRSLAIETTTGESYVLNLGTATFDRLGTYAQLDDRPVAILANAALNQLQPDLLALRSKTLVAASQRDLQRLTIETNSDAPTLELVSEDGQWRISKPRELTADASEVSTLFSQLTFLQARDVLDTPNPNVGVYGLDEPVVTFSAEPKSGDDAVTLALGRSDDGNLYARSSHQDAIAPDSNPIASVESNSLDSIPFELFDLRDKTLGDIAPTLIGAIAIDAPNSDLNRTLTRADSEEGADAADALWNVSDQSDRQVSADAILEPITTAEAVAFFTEDDAIATQALAEP
ncbi:MAG: DUF4340 domain-containing protein, partial [Cyanobacteria bacterium J06648_11]